MDPALFETLVTQIYDAALEPALWPAVVTAIRESLGTQLAALIEADWSLWPAGSIISLDLAGATGGGVGPDSATPAMAEPMLISSPVAGRGMRLTRDADLSKLDPAQSAIAERLLPHLERALQLQRRMIGVRLERDLAAQALDGLATGAILTDESARILYSNRTAKRLLAAGTLIAASQGRLCTMRADRTKELRALIAAAARAESGSTMDGDVLPLETDEQQAVALLVCSFQSAESFFGSAVPVALVLVHDAARAPDPSLAVLRELYGLTPAQARLLIALINGERLGDYARRTGVTGDTAKFHLKQIFEKTGTSRQADLIRQVLANPMVRLAHKFE